MKRIKEIEIGELFSFAKRGSVHMVTAKTAVQIEYKSFNDGKIRVYYINDRLVYLRPTWERVFEAKWFKF